MAERQSLTIHKDWIGCGLTEPELMIIARLESYWRAGHLAYPSDEYLGQQVDMHPRKVQRTIHSLEKKGWLRRETGSETRSRGGKFRYLHPTEKIIPTGVLDKSDQSVPDKSVEPVLDESVQGGLTDLGLGASHTNARDARFEEWWSEYPKKRAKKACRDKWIRKRLDQQADHLIADLQERKRKDGRWIRGFPPDPLTYLNQERWEDEIEPPDHNGHKPDDDDPFATSINRHRWEGPQ